VLATIKAARIGAAYPSPNARDGERAQRVHNIGFGDTAIPALVELIAHELGTQVGNCIVE
jgi:hypothetical protein